MNWKPIEDLPNNWRSLANDELPPLVKVWEEQADRLRSSGEFQTFMDRLRREIAIETGIIERLYTIDRGITRLLIEQGIDEALIPHGTTDRSVKQVVALIKDQEAAITGLFDFVGGQRTLSTFYIKQIHQLLTQNQDYTEALIPSTGALTRISLISGDWKKQPNNPMRDDGLIHEYCPPEQVQSEMDRLIELHHQHCQQKVSPEVDSAWLHHRFTQIHPFQDGNGRVARCLASLVFIQAEWFPLVVNRDDRKIYIEALEKADQGDLSHLINLFSKSQKQAFIQSLGLSEQVLSEAKRTQIILASIADKLKQNQTASITDKYRTVEKFASQLFDIACQRLTEITDEIKLSVQNIIDNADVFITVSPDDNSKSYYHRYQVIETAKQLKYFANTQTYHQWIQLVIDVAVPTIILISFHSLGHEYRGLLVCSACAYHKNNTEDNDYNIGDIQALIDSPFQFSYADQENILIERFKKWLEEVIITGLEYWNKSI
ncbi:MAG: Fic family protein [Microcystaceae cyanobacterium]